MDLCKSKLYYCAFFKLHAVGQFVLESVLFVRDANDECVMKFCINELR